MTAIVLCCQTHSTPVAYFNFSARHCTFWKFNSKELTMINIYIFFHLTTTCSFFLFSGYGLRGKWITSGVVTIITHFGFTSRFTQFSFGRSQSASNWSRAVTEALQFVQNAHCKRKFAPYAQVNVAAIIIPIRRRLWWKCFVSFYVIYLMKWIRLQINLTLKQIGLDHCISSFVTQPAFC